MPPFCDIFGTAQAYRRRVLQVHPDKNPDPNANGLFVQLHQAYVTLSDAANRAKYDDETMLPAAAAAGSVRPPCTSGASAIACHSCGARHQRSAVGGQCHRCGAEFCWPCPVCGRTIGLGEICRSCGFGTCRPDCHNSSSKRGGSHFEAGTPSKKTRGVHPRTAAAESAQGTASYRPVWIDLSAEDLANTTEEEDEDAHFSSEIGGAGTGVRMKCQEKEGQDQSEHRQQRWASQPSPPPPTTEVEIIDLLDHLSDSEPDPEEPPLVATDDELHYAAVPPWAPATQRQPIDLMDSDDSDNNSYDHGRVNENREEDETSIDEGVESWCDPIAEEVPPEQAPSNAYEVVDLTD
eukprot:SAG31_NODE_808_length_11926_cov_13.255179_2_plen_350_part_00